MHAGGAAPAGVEQGAQVLRLAAAARAIVGRVDSACSRSCSATRASWRNGASTSSSGLIRWRSGGEKPAARTALARKVIASKNGAAPVVRRPASPGCEQRAPARASVSSSSASARRRRWPRGKSRANSSPRSLVAGVSGSSRARRRLAELAAQADARREAEVGEQRRAVDLAQEQAAASPRRAARCSALRSSTPSRWRRRSTGVRRAAASARGSASSGAWRSHSSRRISQRWRSASAAFGSAALSSAVRSQARRAGFAIAARGWRAQCSAEASVRPNSPIGASNGCASSVMQKKVPRIVPCGVASRVQLVYSKRLAGLEHRLVADHRQAAHFLDVAVGVGDDPVARDQLRGDVAAVADGDRCRRRRTGPRRGPTARAGDERPRCDVNSGLAMRPILAGVRADRRR